MSWIMLIKTQIDMWEIFWKIGKKWKNLSGALNYGNGVSKAHSWFEIVFISSDADELVDTLNLLLQEKKLEIIPNL